jgi:anti-sigma-K factor RskA
MNGARQMNPEPHTLAGAYVLQSLNDLERRRFERHMARCPDCAEEMRSLQEATARLALASDRPAPATLRGKVFAEIEHTRQEAPRTAPSRRRALRPLGPGLLVAAACLVAALVAGGVAVDAGRDAQRASALNREITAIVTAPDARRVAGRSDATGTTAIVTSRTLDKALITTGALRPLPEARTYQFWFMRDGTARSAGTLTPDGDADPRTLIASGVRGAQQIGITVERAGGVDRPTSTPFFTTRL